MTQAKKLYIKTYGCQMNVYDSHKIGDVMHVDGYQLTETPEDADMIVLNTCNVREKAADKVYSELGRMREYKELKNRKGEECVLVVAGCVGQAEGEEVFRRAHYVDVVVGPQSFAELPALAKQALNGKRRNINLDFPLDAKFDTLPESHVAQGVSAFLSIQEGCDKFCHFCSVPYTRGAEFSRPVAAIYREALALVASGAKEITLLGQNVNAFHGEGPEGNVWNLGNLLMNLAKIDGLERLRYTTSHPLDMHEDLYLAHASEPKLMPFVHLPLQSGSNAILKAMNRKHEIDIYLQAIERLRAARPDMGFSSDFIIGYPGETDQDFADTLAIVREVGFAQAYSFKYSPRPGTPAADRPQIAEEIKDQRLALLQSLIIRQQKAFHVQTIGKTMPVLFDQPGKQQGQIQGKTPYLQSFYTQAPTELIGTIQRVRINEAYNNSISGDIL